MPDHPCGRCLNWWECNGVAWDTTCPFNPELERGATAPPWPKINPNIFEDKTESGLFEED